MEPEDLVTFQAVLCFNCGFERLELVEFVFLEENKLKLKLFCANCGKHQQIELQLKGDDSKVELTPSKNNYCG